MSLFSRRKMLSGMFAVLMVAGAGVAAAKTEPTAYLATDLVSDQPGVAPIVDPNLINAWGIAVPPTGAFWVSSEGVGLSTLYAGDLPGSPLTKVPLEVSIPGGHPTGQVFNPTSDFVVTSGTASGPALFIFATLTGAVTGWNPTVPPPAPSTTAQLGFQATDNAIYTGIALANNGTGNFLYLADFRNREIDVLDANFHLVQLAGAFTDPDLPADYAPFNVAAIGGKLYAAYAKQDAAAEEEIAGPHLGFVDVFDLNGNFEKRLVSQGELNAPCHPLQIDGLWGLAFGNGVTAGSATTLYYAAGPDDEKHGLFGKITANPARTNPVQATLTGGDLVITGSRNDDHVDVDLGNGQLIVVSSGGQQIGSFDLASVSTIQFHGWAGDDRVKIAKDIGVLAILDGGAGNDSLTAGGGSTILLGGTGDDDLLGADHRDILIGGGGRDRLRAGSDDDLLIGGATAHDGNVAALLQILAEWTSTDSYATRIDALRNGTGGLPRLDATTVFDDGVADTLRGNQGLDWFFAGPDDELPDRLSTEQVN